MAKLPYDVVEVRLRMPKHMADKLQTMADAYGISRQAVILMIVGQQLDITQKAMTEIVKGLGRTLEDMEGMQNWKDDK